MTTPPWETRDSVSPAGQAGDNARPAGGLSGQPDQARGGPQADRPGGPLGQPIRPVERPVPLRQSVYDALVELIVDGSLAPGQHLVEAELARHLGVSRQPVREALHRLRAEGWVELRPGQGAFVHVPTEVEVDQLLDVRALLESEAARTAARSASPEEIARLRVLLGEGADALAAGDPERVAGANTALHTEITAASGNAVLAELTGIVKGRMRWYHRSVALTRGEGSWEEHEALIDAIEAGDASRAADIMRRHVEETRTAHHERIRASAGPASPA